jgi:PRTRC genetic system protein A
MADLAGIFGDLVTHQTLAVGAELPPPRPGISWIWAANGVFKRGVDAHLDLLIRVASSPPVPGLAQLRPHVRFRAIDARVPSHILDNVLIHARCLRRIEQQYAVLWQSGQFSLVIPPQDASAARVRYGAVPGTLVDIHSHHEMRAFFSDIDDRDDLGLSVSAVIGRLHTDQPEIIMRANVYGHRQRLNPTEVFASLGLLAERSEHHGETSAHARVVR